MKPLITLDQWSVMVVCGEGGRFVSPDWDASPVVLCGEAYGHPDFAECQHVTTSYVVGGDLKTQQIFTKSGSRYCLKNPHQNYENNHPSARQRLIANICGTPVDEVAKHI